MSRVIKVKRSEVYAARAREQLDRRLNRRTPDWVKRLAEIELPAGNEEEGEPDE